MSTVFIAGPFKALVDAESEPRYRELRTTIEELIDFFNSISWNVLNAHTREQWGAAFLQPNESTRLDYDQITSADLVVALPGDPPSPGTHIEIGWATALCRPLTIITESVVYNTSALLRGMAELRQFRCQIFRYQERPREVFDGVLERVSDLANSQS